MKELPETGKIEKCHTQLFSKALKGTNTHHNGHRGRKFQTELILEIYSKSLVRAIDKVLIKKFS